MNDFTGDPYYHVRDSITDRIIEIERRFHAWKIDSSSEREGDAILKSVEDVDQSLTNFWIQYVQWSRNRMNSST